MCYLIVEIIAWVGRGCKLWGVFEPAGSHVLASLPVLLSAHRSFSLCSNSRASSCEPNGFSFYQFTSAALDFVEFFTGEPAGSRTQNLAVKSRLLCQLSYGPIVGNPSHSRQIIKITLKIHIHCIPFATLDITNHVNFMLRR